MVTYFLKTQFRQFSAETIAAEATSKIALNSILDIVLICQVNFFYLVFVHLPLIP